MDKIDDLLDQATQLEEKYERHFKNKLPSRMIWWWEPTNIVLYPKELEAGVKRMRKDIDHAIETDTPFKGLSKEDWDRLVF